MLRHLTSVVTEVLTPVSSEITLIVNTLSEAQVSTTAQNSMPLITMQLLSSIQPLLTKTPTHLMTSEPRKALNPIFYISEIFTDDT
jgi:hypothetical protein